jgi:hypothetical protein
MDLRASKLIHRQAIALALQTQPCAVRLMAITRHPGTNSTHSTHRNNEDVVI